MSKVEILDLWCECDKKEGIGELDGDTQDYRCLRCNTLHDRDYDIKNLQDKSDLLYDQIRKKLETEFSEEETNEIMLNMNEWADAESELDGLCD